MAGVLFLFLLRCIFLLRIYILKMDAVILLEILIKYTASHTAQSWYCNCKKKKVWGLNL